MHVNILLKENCKLQDLFCDGKGLGHHMLRHNVDVGSIVGEGRCMRVNFVPMKFTMRAEKKKKKKRKMNIMFPLPPG